MATKRPANSDALLMLALEILAVGVFTVLAGTSNEMGTIVILFMIGLWIIYMVQNSAVIAGLEKGLEAASNG
jgi:hypothetical protein